MPVGDYDDLDGAFDIKRCYEHHIEVWLERREWRGYSLVMLDADGEALGVYRKSHIPDGPGYQEKYYFRPGDTGFRVWDTRFGKVGVGIKYFRIE